MYPVHDLTASKQLDSCCMGINTEISCSIQISVSAQTSGLGRVEDRAVLDTARLINSPNPSYLSPRLQRPTDNSTPTRRRVGHETA